MLKSLSPAQAIWLVFAITLATILGAWGFQFAGYPPCELCLAQRYAYYTVVPLSLIFAVAGMSNPKVLKWGLIIVGLIMLGSCIFGIYHSGVEWKWWPGPTACTGGGELTGLPDLTKRPVMCDEPAIRILGLSLAGWNAVVSAIASFIAFSKVKADP